MEEKFIKIVNVGRNAITTKNVEREKMLKLFREISDNFSNNNEISKQFVEIIPDLKVIEIDRLRNAQCDVPFINCEMNDGTSKVIRILRWHKIIWSILDEFCKEEFTK